MNSNLIDDIHHYVYNDQIEILVKCMVKSTENHKFQNPWTIFKVTDPSCIAIQMSKLNYIAISSRFLAAYTYVSCI